MQVSFFGVNEKPGQLSHGTEILQRVQACSPGYVDATYILEEGVGECVSASQKTESTTEAPAESEDEGDSDTVVYERLDAALLDRLIVPKCLPESFVEPVVVIGLPIKQSQLVYEHLVDESGVDPRKMFLVPRNRRN